jgi:head-tail adaptor
MARAGSLRDSVRFERRGPAGNVGGVVKASWSPLCGPFRAEIKPLRGGETIQAARMAGRDQVLMSLHGCRALAEVTSDDRVVDARDPTRTWNIVAPPTNPDGRGQWIEITAERGGSDG